VAHTVGLHPHRILLFGNGLVVGWGVSSHDLALTGQLARAVTAVTGRGSEVHAAGDPNISMATAADAVATLDLSGYDAIVVHVGASDAFQLIRHAEFHRHLLELIGAIRRQAPRTPVLLLGIGPVSRIPFFRTRFDEVTDAWSEQLDAIAAELVEGTRDLGFVPAIDPATAEGHPRDEGEGRYRSPEHYRRIAARIAERLSEILPVHSDSDRREDPQPLERRLRALHELGILDTDREERFDRIVGMARDVFGTESAAFTLIDRDRQWHKARLGISSSEGPLEESFCATTIRAEGPLVVEDADHDPRPLPRTDIRFYVGYPVETPDGTRIGAICVFDREPRPVNPVQVGFLRELALTLQLEIGSAAGGAFFGIPGPAVVAS
jgi:lysophospholipase L1-like esterase